MKKTIFLILFSVFSQTLPAQEKAGEYRYWMTIELYLSNNNVSVGTNYSFSLGDYFYKAGYFFRSAFSLGDKPAVDNTGHYYRCTGQRFQSEWFQAAFFAGPAYVFGEKRVIFEYQKYSTAGLQTDIQLLFRIANEIGIGVGLYGNLNFEQSYAGINLNITMGNGK